MKNDYQSPDFKKLLDKLQQESWQLELIISGFAIYGLITAMEPMEVEYLKKISNSESLGIFYFAPLLTSMGILIMLLLTHVVMRGLWIGAIGLRYVSGDIDYKQLNYSKKFTDYLRKKVGSFDWYISRLENICSTLFALAFLMIFIFISVFLLAAVFGIVTYYLNEIETYSETLSTTLKWGFGILYALCLFLLLIDFLGAGLLKRYKWTSKIYFPIYRIFGFLSLSILYRPLLYNFLDQKRARWIGIFIVPVYLVFSMIYSGYGRQKSNYLIDGQNTSDIYTNKENYEDQLTEEGEMMRFVSIPSKVIETSYLPVFVGFNDWMEDAVFHQDTTLTPEQDERGYGFTSEKFTTGSGTLSIIVDSEESLADQRKYLKAYGDIFNLYVDSVIYDTDYVMTENTAGRFGFETFLDLKGVSRGKHHLRLVGPKITEGKTFTTDTLITIPFWYYKE